MTSWKISKEQIVEAASEILRREGAKKLTQPEVTRALGIHHSCLTYNVPRRADLLMAIAAHFLERTSAEFDALRATKSRPEPLSVIGAVHRLVTDPDTMRTFLGLLVEADQDAALRVTLALYMEEFAALVAQYLGRPDADEAVRVLLAAFRGIGLENLLLDRKRSHQGPKTDATGLGLLSGSPQAKTAGRSTRAPEKTEKLKKTP